MVRTIIRLIALSSLLLIKTTFALTQVTATVDRNPVIEKESFILQVIADDEVSANAFDTSPLLKNFIVGRTSVSSQTSMVNFKTTRTTQWTTVLVPRAAGHYVIPPLSIESLSTSPIKLDVLKANDKPKTATQDIFITTEVSSKEVYVQQQLTLTIKLHFATELKRGSLSEPSLEGANITQIGKDKEVDSVINGRRYRVIERNYAINPQNSGEYTIKTPVFSGEVISQSNRRSNFLSFADTKPVNVLGEDINIIVKPIPENYQGFWLPSEILQINQEWQPANEVFVVGEPITRTITLTAAGLSEEQLPKIEIDVPKGIKIYPDQAELHTGINSNRLVSQQKQNFALVASKVGTYLLPEIRIPWWNTITNRVQYAVIPAKTITIIPNEDMLENEIENDKPDTLNNDTQIAPTGSSEVASAETITVIVKEASWLQWLFLALWLITSFAWLLTTVIKKENKPKKAMNVTLNSYKALIKACEQSNGEQVLKLIVPWAKEHFINYKVSTIEQAKNCINLPEFDHALIELQQSFFGRTTQAWQGKALLALIKTLNKQPYNVQPTASEPSVISLNP